MDQPLVSVLMTAYNREKYIAEAIESVLNSSYSNFELIVVDDRSTDRTVEIARGFEQKDRRVNIYINEQNLGDYPNRNKAASLAKGKYLKYVDSDDLIYPHGLQVLVSSMEKFSDSALGFPRTNQPYGPHPFRFEPARSYKAKFLEGSFPDYAPNSAIIRRDVFMKEGGFTSEPWILEAALGDYEFWLRLTLKYPVVFCVGEVVWGRIHGEQESYYKQKTHMVNAARFRITIDYLECARQFFTNAEYQKAMQRVRQNHARYILSQLLKKLDLQGGYKLYKASRLTIAQLLKGFHGYDVPKASCL